MPHGLYYHFDLVGQRYDYFMVQLVMAESEDNEPVNQMLINYFVVFDLSEARFYLNESKKKRHL